MYAYDDARVYAINSAFLPVPGPLWAEAYLFTPDGVTFSTSSGGLSTGLEPDAVAALFAVMTPAAVRARLGPNRTYFVSLALHRGLSAAGPIISQGTYWLSTTEDVLDWGASTFYNTPCSAFADYRDLLGLGPPKLEVGILKHYLHVRYTKCNWHTSAKCRCTRITRTPGQQLLT